MSASTQRRASAQMATGWVEGWPQKRRRSEAKSQSEKFRKAMQAAVEVKWHEIFKLLESELPYDLVHQSDEKGTSLLHVAAQKGSPDIVNRLCAKLADPNKRDSQGKTPLDLSQSIPDVHTALSAWNLKVVDQANSMMLASCVGEKLIKSLGQTSMPVLPEVVLREHEPTQAPCAEYFKRKSDESAREAHAQKAIIQFAGLVGNKKGAPLFQKIKNVLEDMVRHQLAQENNPIQAPKDFHHFMDFTSFSAEDLFQLIFANPHFLSAVSIQNAEFFEHNGIDFHQVDGTSLDAIPVISNLPNGRSEQTWFQKCCATLNEHKYPLFCIPLTDLDDPMGNFKKAYFCSLVNNKLQPLDLTLEEKIDILITVCLWYAECIHSVIHIFQNAMIASLATAVREAPDLRILYTFFSPSVLTKAYQVQNLLLSDEELGNAFKGHLTHLSFQCNGQSLRAVLRDMLQHLGSCGGAEDVTQMFMPDISAMKNAPPEIRNAVQQQHDLTWLADFRAFADFVPGYAQALAAAMKTWDDTAFRRGEAGLRNYFAANKASLGFEVTSWQQWLELISITGLFHGTTISFTKLFFSPSSLSLTNLEFETNSTYYAPLKREDDEFTEKDFEVVTVAMATVIGHVREREVFFDPVEMMGALTEHEKRNISESAGDRFFLDPSKEFFKILQEFASKSAFKKMECLNKRMLQLEEEFVTRGWIFSDSFPSGFSNNAMTLTTSI